MASNRDERRQETHFRVMRLLEEDPSISTRDIAQKVGISNGSAYYCVTALIDKGYVELRNLKLFERKANYLYVLTPRGIRAKAALTVQFLERKRTEYQKLKLEIDKLESELRLERNDITNENEESV